MSEAQPHRRAANTDYLITGSSPVLVDVTWTDEFGRTAVSPTKYLVDPRWPRIDSFEPSSGSALGGDAVTVKGAYFPTTGSPIFFFGKDSAPAVKRRPATLLTTWAGHCRVEHRDASHAALIQQQGHAVV